MPIARKGVSPRFAVGVVSVGKSQRQEGFQPTEPDRMYKEKPHKTGRGTPSRPKIPRVVRFVQRPKVDPIREYESVFLSAHASIREAVSQLSTLFEPHATPQAKKLAFVVTSLVEKERILKCFSSAVAAVVCIQIAAVSLSLKPLLSGTALEKLEIVPDAVRIAYNHLWVHRGKLEDVIWNYGGDPLLLPSPTAADGGPDMISFCKGTGIPILRRWKWSPRHASFEGRRSPLRLVSYPSEECEPTPNARADPDTDSDSDSMSIES